MTIEEALAWSLRPLLITNGEEQLRALDEAREAGAALAAEARRTQALWREVGILRDSLRILRGVAESGDGWLNGSAPVEAKLTEAAIRRLWARIQGGRDG